MIIQKTSLANEVANKLKSCIQSGQYVPNEKLPNESELMKLFGVGRSTVREAVRMLANAGFLRVQQGVGTFIEENIEQIETLQERLKRAKAKEVNEVRHLIEEQIVQLAAKNHTLEQLDKIEISLNRRGKAAIQGQLEECIQADIDFHLAITEASGNEILTDIYKAFLAPLNSWFKENYKDTDSFKESHPFHQLLFQSIKERNEKKAYKTMNQILDKF